VDVRVVEIEGEFLVDPIVASQARLIVLFRGMPVGFSTATAAEFENPESLRVRLVEEHRTSITERLATFDLGRGGLWVDRSIWRNVSVVMCTRDRPEDVGDCLDSIPAHIYEIVVVDNAPSDDRTQAICEARPNVRYVKEMRPGLDWARSRGVLEASGDIVAFIDDDVRVTPLWLDALQGAFATGDSVKAVTGLVAPYMLETEAQRLFEDNYGGFGRGFRPWWTTVPAAELDRAAKRFGLTQHYGTGANMAFDRSHLLDVGLFDPAMDVGTPTNGGGDLEMFFRSLKAGVTLAYAPHMLVLHRHRRDIAELERQLENNGIGMASYLTCISRRYPSERAAAVRLWRELRDWNTWRLKEIATSGRVDVPIEMIEKERAGLVTGLDRYRQARRLASTVAHDFERDEVTDAALKLLQGGSRDA